MTTSKLKAGEGFPSLLVRAQEDGSSVDISKPLGEANWKMVIVYRGYHCPMCIKFMNQLEAFKERLEAIGVEIAAISADTPEQLEGFMEKVTVTYPVYSGLSLDQMKGLGLYISNPRSPEETDHIFPEPGFFVINEEGTLQVVDISNNPFMRPNLEIVTMGLEFIRGNSYPIRGTYSD